MHAGLNEQKLARQFSSDGMPGGLNIITAKWVFSWKTDANGPIIKAMARLIARGFGQRFAVNYVETFADIPAMTSIKLVMTVAVQGGLPFITLTLPRLLHERK